MSEWTEVEVSQVARFHRGVTWSKDQELREPSSDAVPVLRIPNIQNTLNLESLLWIKGVTVGELKQYAAVKGYSLMVGSNGNPDRVGNCIFLSEDSQFLFASFLIGAGVYDARKITPEYLYRLLSGPEIQHFISKETQGTTGLCNINLSRLKQRRVALPPLPQQRRIAEILSTVDEAIEQTERLIAKQQQIKAGLMQDLFTRGVWTAASIKRARASGSPAAATAEVDQLRPPRGIAPELYKESPLGWIPKDWEALLLDTVSTRGSGHTPDRNHSEYWNGGIKWVSLADSRNLDKLFIRDTEHEISQLGIENSSATIHPPGCVILSRDAGIGKSSILAESMAVSQHFMCWRCGDRLLNYYLYYLLQHSKRDFEAIAMGSTIPTIGLQFFRSYRVVLPNDYEEQEYVAGVLLATEDKHKALVVEEQKLKKQKQGLMQDLLTGIVLVKP